MATKKVGILIKEARTAAGLTQEKLAKAAGENLTAAMISKCERGQEDLTNNQLKKIAVACGVTQSSLLNAPKNLSTAAEKKEEESKKVSGAKTGTSKKTSSASKTSSVKKPAAKTSSDKTDTSAKTASPKTGSAKTSASKTPAGATNTIKVTAAEKKLVETYRAASAKLKKAAVKLLKGDYGDDPEKILSLTSGDASGVTDGIGDVIGDMLSGFLNRK